MHDIKCYSCGLLGHMLLSAEKRLVRARYHGLLRSQWSAYRAGIVEGTKVDNIILDTGAAKTIVHSRLVPSHKLTTQK